MIIAVHDAGREAGRAVAFEPHGDAIDLGQRSGAGPGVNLCVTRILRVPAADLPFKEAGGPAEVAERCPDMVDPPQRRSAEHTSEHQSLMRKSYAVFCVKK